MYSLASRQLKPIKLWNRNGRTVVPEPFVGPNLTPDLLVCIARAAVLANPVRQRKPDHELLFGQIPSLGINIDSDDADIEAAMYPVLHVNDATCVRGSVSEPQCILRHSRRSPVLKWEEDQRRA